MTNWTTGLHELFERVDDWSDTVRYRLDRLAGYDTLFVTPYMGYGTANAIHVRGRVLENPPADASDASDSTWRNLAAMYRHFETDEVPKARVRITCDGFATDTITDSEGYFDGELVLDGSSQGRLRRTVDYEVVSPILDDGSRATASGEVIVPPESARFAVISDIDDTVLKTGVRDRVKMLLTTLLSNAHTRLPFEGVAAFYRALQAGASGHEDNPVFYLSSSPYNLYSLLVEFMRIHDIPAGPIFLRDFGTHTPFTASDHGAHKLAHVRMLLRAYPHLRFILIGDDGEHDPQIYGQIASEQPSRIRAIYIRQGDELPAQNGNLERLAADVAATGVRFVTVRDSLAAAEHAAGDGLIATEALAEIGADATSDRQSPEPDDLNEDSLVTRSRTVRAT